MELFRIIKNDAKRAMRFCGGRSIASVMIIALSYLAINLTETVLLMIFCGMDALYYETFDLFFLYPETVYITLGALVVWLFLIPALLLGHTKLFLSFAEGKDESLSLLFDMFSTFKKFIGSAFFAIGYSIRYIIVLAVATLPGGAFIWFAANYIPSGNRTADLLKIAACCIGIAIIILCVFLSIIFVQRWSLAPYYRASGNGIHKSFVLSAKATKGLYTYIISFKISFIGWGLLSLLVIPLIWTAPYYGLANAIFAKYLMERYEHSLASVPETGESEVNL